MKRTVVEVLFFSSALESAVLSLRKGEWTLAALLGAVAVTHFLLRKGWRLFGYVKELSGPLPDRVGDWMGPLLAGILVRIAQVIGALSLAYWLSDNFSKELANILSADGPKNYNIYNMLISCVVCPLIEGLTFYGYLFRTLTARTGLKWSCLITLAVASAFGGFSANEIFFSMILLALCLRTGSVVPGIILQGLWNLAALRIDLMYGLLSKIPQSDYKLVSGLLVVICLASTLSFLITAVVNAIKQHLSVGETQGLVAVK